MNKLIMITLEKSTKEKFPLPAKNWQKQNRAIPNVNYLNELRIFEEISFLNGKVMTHQHQLLPFFKHDVLIENEIVFHRHNLSCATYHKIFKNEIYVRAFLRR
jgi:hypothetical protein